VGVKVVRCFDKGRGRQPARDLDDTVLNPAILRDQHGERAGRLDADELDVLQAHVLLGGEHDAGAARQARKHMPRFRQSDSTDFPSPALLTSFSMR
jgi:hypothetical protein